MYEKDTENQVENNKITIENKLRDDILLIESENNNELNIPKKNNIFDYEIYFIKSAKISSDSYNDTIDYESINGDVYRTVMGVRPMSLFMPSLSQSRKYWKSLFNQHKEPFDSVAHRQVYLTTLNGYRKYARNEFISTNTAFYTTSTPDNCPCAISTWDTEAGKSIGFDKFSKLLSLSISIASVDIVSSEVTVNSNLQYISKIKFKNNSSKKVIGLMIYDSNYSNESLYNKINDNREKSRSKIKVNIHPGKTTQVLFPTRSMTANIVIAQIYYRDGTIESTISDSL